MIDDVPERLAMAQTQSGAEIIDFSKDDVYESLMQMTRARGPDSCMDAVGLEAHAGGTIDGVLDRVKTATMLATDRSHVLRQAIMSCRNGGTISIPGVYVGFVDKLPFGAAMNKGLTLKMGQTHVQKYMPMLFEKIQTDEFDPSLIITHRMKLEEAPQGYKIFNEKEEMHQSCP